MSVIPYKRTTKINVPWWYVTSVTIGGNAETQLVAAVADQQILVGGIIPVTVNSTGQLVTYYFGTGNHAAADALATSETYGSSASRMFCDAHRPQSPKIVGPTNTALFGRRGNRAAAFAGVAGGGEFHVLYRYGVQI